MRQTFIVLSFLLLALFPFQVQTQSPVSVAVSVSDTAHAAAHHIRFDSKTDWDECSATAVGPHTLLSAAHCVLGTGKLQVDGRQLHIVSTIYDENDHVLIVLDGEFPTYLPIDSEKPTAGQRVRICGWPGRAKNPVTRDGTFEETEQSYFDGEYQVWQLPVFPGDSGSGLITDEGKVIAVVSLGNDSAETMSYPFQFTVDQLHNIR